MIQLMLKNSSYFKKGTWPLDLGMTISSCNGSESCAFDGQDQMTARPELVCFLMLPLSAEMCL